MKSYYELLPALGSVGVVFDLMEVAEDEIASAKRRWPDDEKIIYRSFQLMVPTRSVLVESLYRCHVRELILRVRTGKDTRPGTSAEVLGLLKDSSLASPLKGYAVMLYGRLFCRLFPTEAEGVWATGALEYEEKTHGCQADELFAEAQRKLSVDSRKAISIEIAAKRMEQSTLGIDL